MCSRDCLYDIKVYVCMFVQEECHHTAVARTGADAWRPSKTPPQTRTCVVCHNPISSKSAANDCRRFQRRLIGRICTRPPRNTGVSGSHLKLS